jgi:hypothetical protein
MKTIEGSEKEQIIQAFDQAYEQLIAAATTAEAQGTKMQGSEWRPREILGHIVGWAAQATAFLPQVIAGLPPQTYASDLQHDTIDERMKRVIDHHLEHAQELEAVGTR